MRRPCELTLFLLGVLSLAPRVVFAESDAARGERLYQEGKYAEAAEAIEKAFAEDPDEVAGELALALGNCYVNLQNWEAAIGAFRRAIALKAETAEVHGAIGHAQASLGRLAEAIASFARAARLDPEGPYELLIARLFVQREEWLPASMESARYLRTHADSVEAWELLAYALSRGGRGSEAAEAYRVLARIQPTNADYRLGVGQAEANERRFGEAIDALEAATRLGGGSLEAHADRLLGDLYLQQRMSQEAAAAYARLLTSGEGDGGIASADDWYRLGHVRLMTEETASAREAFTKASAADPSAPHAGAALELARLAAQAGEVEEARRWFDAAAKADPKDPSACVARAQFEMAGERWDEAAAALGEAVARGERAAEVLNGRALALANAGKKEEAWSALKEGLREHPHDVGLRALLRRLAE